MDGPWMVLEVETPLGVFLRRIRPATLLPEDCSRGEAAERATRSAAAYWGLPDFVFRAKVYPRGSATRELGDAVVVVGNVAASVQVKSRHAPSDSEDRERLWLDKNIEKGARQAAGTIRNLRSAEAGLINERDREVEIKGQSKTWIPVVVVDHPSIEAYVPKVAAVVLLRRDWNFLFEQLKSTYAVLEYLSRIAGDNPIPLGDEPVRYYELAAADAVAPPSLPDSRLHQFMSTYESAPILPRAPAGHGDDQKHALVRVVLEDITTSPLPVSVTQADRLELLAAIDATPVGYRSALGEMWLSWLGDAGKAAESETRWRFRGHIWPERPYLIFGATARHDARVQQAFGTYVSLRHQQHLEAMPERSGMMTVGVLLTLRADGRRPFDTTVVATSGDQEIDAADRQILERLWGKIGDSVIAT